MEERSPTMDRAPFTDQAILGFNPFDGDFGDIGDRVFKDKMVIARKPGPCFHCQCEIKKGERVRSRVEKSDGELMSFRWCADCCAVMGAIMTCTEGSGDAYSDAPDPEEQWEERMDLAIVKATT